MDQLPDWLLVSEVLLVVGNIWAIAWHANNSRGGWILFHFCTTVLMVVLTMVAYA